MRSYIHSIPIHYEPKFQEKEKEGINTLDHKDLSSGFKLKLVQTIKNSSVNIEITFDLALIIFDGSQVNLGRRQHNFLLPHLQHTEIGNKIENVKKCAVQISVSY